MANRCQCPPVACRGVFKYLTYLIPIRECSQHPGPGIVYRGFVKLKKGASVAHYYITSIPLGSVATHLHNGIYLISIILDAIIYKCTFFLNVVKPPLERFILYLNTYYVSSLAEDSVEETKSEVSGDKLSKSYSKLAKSETLSSKSVDSAKTVATAKSVDSAKTGATAKTVDSAKTGATAKSVDSAKTGATAKSESLTKTGSAVKSEGPAMTENNLKSEGSTKSGITHKSAPPQLRSPFDFDYEVDFEPDDSISGSEEVKIEQIKVEQSTVESNTVEPVGAAEPGTAESGTAESGTAESGTAEPEIELTPPVQRRHRRSLPRRLVTCVFKPVRYAFHGMVDILKGTKDNFVHAGSCTYNYLASCPLWIYLYVIFVSLTVSYIVYETYITYKCRIWLQATKLPAQIREGCKEFILPDTTLKQVMAKLRTEIDKGLNPKTKASSSVKCFTTYVQDLPTGEENGKFLALDLGGTNFRVLLITLNGRHFDMQSKIYVIPQDVMVGTSQNLFNHIAVCLADFTVEHRVSKDNLPLGFTFSFPLKQEGLSKGILQRWTKGFNCPEAIGKDVVEQLRDAIEAHGDLHIDIMAILNDTTGTLMSCAWKNHNTKIGVILGTGTNACYVEKIENVIDFDGDKSKPYVLINTEWGAFGDNGELEFIRTSYDKEVDNKSINPGMQIHEKLISGMYLGEIVRLLLVKFISDNLIFNGKLTEEIQQSGHIPTKFLSEVESDKRGCFKECKKALAKLGYNQVTDEDCNSVRFVCECVSRRAAHLASAALATIINKMGHTSLTIGVDGSLYRYHPHFHDLMVQKISQLIDEKIMNVNLMLSEDGSGRGAALVAASLY